MEVVTSHVLTNHKASLMHPTNGRPLTEGEQMDSVVRFWVNQRSASFVQNDSPTWPVHDVLLQE
jgi:hypothetical protein